MISNGLTECGFDDGYTYVSKTGSSVIDYFIMSCELFDRVHVEYFKVGSVQFSSVQDGIYALGKAHLRSTPSLRSFPNLAHETVPILV